MIGERLKRLRKEEKMRQEELANIIGVQKSAVSLYELDKNDPSDKIKIKIANHFNISLDYLLGIVDDPVPFYSQDRFLTLPEDMTEEERVLLSEFLDYLNYRRNNT